MLNRCLSCIYIGNRTLGDCAYLSKTGELRSTICPPGNECTVFKPAKGRAPAWDVVAGYKLYMEGQTFEQIGAAVFASPGTVQMYAKKYWPPRKETEDKKEEPMKKILPRADDVDVIETNPPCPEPELPAPDQQPVSVPAQIVEPKSRPVTQYDLLETAIGKKSGVEAYLTGHAIGCLCNWQCKDDLREAKKAIDALLDRLEA